MPITITATIGSASANSFVTEAEFIAYVAERPNAHTSATTSGSTATEAEKAALVQAARELDAALWHGSRVDAVQRLAWPRAYVPDPDYPVDPDSLSESDVGYLDSATIPRRIKDAQCELAVQFLKAGATDLSMPSSIEGVTRRRIDVLETEYQVGSLATRGFARFPLVAQWVTPLLKAGGGQRTVVRG
jgi:hypothetical protein